MQSVVIRHLSGSKADQVEEFPLDQFKVLTLGRNTDQIIQYDPDKDDLVSRKHARISREEDQEDRFLITDVGSSHGTYVNKQRISGTASILPGDMIQLGPGGPEFQFDLQPRPNGMIRPTREITEVRETRESATNSGLATPPTKTSVGRATVERMLGQYQQGSRKVLINLAAALVGVLVIVAGALVYLNQKTETKLAAGYQQLTKQIEITRDMVNVVNQPTSPTDPTMSPAEIVKKFGQSTVYIEAAWKLIHTKSDRQVYQFYPRYEGKKYPAYIQVDGKVYPWLSLENDNDINVPIGTGSGYEQGSGFVVTNNGFVLTNRHVAAPWHTRYDFPPGPSVVFGVDPNTKKVQYVPNTKPNANLRLQWVPANERLLVEKRNDGFYVVPGSHFEGRFDRLDVTFPKNKLRIPARLVRMSDQHDVALIKVDVPDSVPKVDIHDSYSESRPGDVITILGYPGVSPDIYVRTKSQDPFNPSPQIRVVPELTVTGGLIGKIIRGEAIPKGGDSYDYESEFGDVIQLTANAAGQGNSGGPVFDDRGRVIGIFFAGLKRDVQISAAVPIRFGMDIMGIKPVLE
jgi:serine protease Do